MRLSDREPTLQSLYSGAEYLGEGKYWTLKIQYFLRTGYVKGAVIGQCVRGDLGGFL